MTLAGADLLGLNGAQPQGGGVLHDLVGLLNRRLAAGADLDAGDRADRGRSDDHRRAGRLCLRTPRTPPRSGPTWRQFLTIQAHGTLRSQADALLACDFFETVTLTGAHLHVLAVIEHASRRVRILGA